MKYQYLLYITKPGFNSFYLYEDYKSAHEAFMKQVVEDKEALYGYRIGIRKLNEVNHKVKVSMNDILSLGSFLPPERFLQSLCFTKLG